MLATLPLYRAQLIHQCLQSFLEETFQSAGKLPTPFFSMDTVMNVFKINKLLCTLSPLSVPGVYLSKPLTPKCGRLVTDACVYPKCAIGNAYIPELQGRFFATENFFYTSEVCVV